MQKLTNDSYPIINYRCILFSAISLALGIIVAVEGNFILFLISLASFLTPTIFLSFNSNKRVAGILYVCIPFFIVGFLLTIITLTYWQQPLAKEQMGENYISCHVIEIIDKDSYIVSNIKIDGNPILGNSTLDIDTRLLIGERIGFNGVTFKTPLFENNKMNYYRLSKSLAYQINATSNLLYSDGHTSISAIIKNGVKNLLFDNMNYNVAGISYAMLFGDKSYISHTISNNFKVSGISHIFAVSGLHIGAFFLLFQKLFHKHGKVNKIIKLALPYTLTLCYATICGFSPSTIRALVMLVSYKCAGIFNRQKDSIASLCTAMIVVLLLNPLDLYSTGFLLSFACMFGLIVISQPINYRFQKWFLRKYPDGYFFFLTKLSGVSVIIGIFIISTPIISMTFGYIPIFSPIINLIFSPLLVLAYSYNLLAIIPTLLLGINFFIPSNILIGAVIDLLNLLNKTQLYFDVTMTAVQTFLLLALIFLTSNLFFFKKSTKRNILLATCILFSLTALV